MANFSSVLKDEIARIARKELRKVVDPMKKQVTSLRHGNAALKRENLALKRELSSLARGAKKEAVIAAEPSTEGTHRFSADGLKKLRAKLGISAGSLGELVGASALSIYNWENGKVRPRADKIARIAAIRGMGKREVQQLLEEKAGGKVRKARRKRAA